MEKSKLNDILKENERRRKNLFPKYDPYTGEGSPIKRKLIEIPSLGFKAWLPEEMFTQPFFRSLIAANSLQEIIDTYPDINSNIDIINALNTERFICDFEFWAVLTITIHDKDSLKAIPFVLRPAQRKVLAELERLRTSGVPIYIILLKARQWGGSTLIQIYMMWIQQIHRSNWHLAVCAQDDSAAANVSEMYSRASESYPTDVGSITLKPYARSPKNRICEERGGIIGVGSVNNPRQFRSYNYPMIHASEVGLWGKTLKRDPEELAASLFSAVPTVPYSLIAIESTAKGIGNYFHKMWTNAVKGENGFSPVFVAWYEIENYISEIPNYEEFVNGFTDYDWFLWELGATLEGIKWYNDFKKGKGYSDHKMKEEYPSTAEEAFITSGMQVFHPAYIQAVEKDVMEADFLGDVHGASRTGIKAFSQITFAKSSTGRLSIWSKPDKTQLIKHRYAFFADIGGRTDKADFSVLRGIDRYWMLEGEDPEFILTWIGHIDQDLFAWKCAQICMAYALPEIGEYPLLAIETNSLKKTKSDGDHFFTVLNAIAPHYPNLYIRNDEEKVGDGFIPKYGFHTGTKSKGMIIDAHNAAARERYLKTLGEGDPDIFGYVERDIRAVNEMKWYETKPDGSMGAVEGQHDDIEICTAGCIWLSNVHMPEPFYVDEEYHGKRTRKTRSESDF